MNIVNTISQNDNSNRINKFFKSLTTDECKARTYMNEFTTPKSLASICKCSIEDIQIKLNELYNQQKITIVQKDGQLYFSINDFSLANKKKSIHFLIFNNNLIQQVSKRIKSLLEDDYIIIQNLQQKNYPILRQFFNDHNQEIFIEENKMNKTLDQAINYLIQQQYLGYELRSNGLNYILNK